ncbi:MAG: hypothetical protein SWH78_04270 [Thermodesulfobacteriota bacterium]|nr:hypothetical protein [Thermodesulfobacteriota bacterium]
MRRNGKQPNEINKAKIAQARSQLLRWPKDVVSAVVGDVFEILAQEDEFSAVRVSAKPYKWPQWIYSTKKLRHVMNRTRFQDMYNYLWLNKFPFIKRHSHVFLKVGADAADILVKIRTKDMANNLDPPCSKQLVNKYLAYFSRIGIIEKRGIIAYQNVYCIAKQGSFHEVISDNGTKQVVERPRVLPLLTAKAKREIEGFDTIFS